MTERKGVTGRIRYSGSSGRTYSRSKAKLQDVDAGLWVVISSVCPSAHFTRCLQTKTLYQHADNRDPHRLPGVDQSVSSLFLIFIFIVSRPPPCRRISRRRRMTFAGCARSLLSLAPAFNKFLPPQPNSPRYPHLSTPLRPQLK
jgi:hypothetical protein